MAISLEKVRPSGQLLIEATKRSKHIIGSLHSAGRIQSKQHWGKVKRALICLNLRAIIVITWQQAWHGYPK